MSCCRIISFILKINIDIVLICGIFVLMVFGEWFFWYHGPMKIRTRGGFTFTSFCVNMGDKLDKCQVNYEFKVILAGYEYDPE